MAQELQLLVGTLELRPSLCVDVAEEEDQGFSKDLLRVGILLGGGIRGSLGGVR